jgi:hypothetical protein
MNSEDFSIPDPLMQEHDRELFKALSEGQAPAFERLYERYATAIHTLVVNLTGYSDREELGNVTVEIFMDLWSNRDIFGQLARPGIFIYQRSLLHIFGFLKKKGNMERITLLRSILPSFK